MAAGSIIIDLLMRTGSFITDTERSAKQLDKLRKSAEQAGKEIGLSFVAIGAAAGTALAVLDSIASSIGNYQDLADQIGDTAESVAALQLAADQSGTSLESIASISAKLTAGLAGTDDESKALGAGLKALNIDLADFKKLAPVERIEALAKAFASFEDGPGKTAVAIAVLGKSGAEQIKLFNDLADAGGRTVTLTNEQIAAADRFSKQLATLRSEASTLVKVVASDLYPALSDLIDGIRTVGTEFGGAKTVGAIFRNELADMLEECNKLALGLYTVGRYAGAFFAAIDIVRSGNSAGAADLFKNLKADINDADKSLQGLVSRLRDVNGLRGVLTGARLDSSTDPRSTTFGKPSRPVLNFSGAGGGGGGSRSSRGSADKTSEAERYLESLEKQLVRTQDLTTVETVLADLQSGRLKLAGSVSKEQLLAVASRIDAGKNLADQLKVEEQQYQKFLDLQRATKEEGAAVYEATRTPAEKLAAELDRLNKLLEAGTVTWDTYGRAVFQAQDSFDAAMEKANKTGDTLDEFAKNAAKTIQGELGSTLADVIGGNFDNIGDRFSALITRMVAEALAADIVRSLFGSSGGEGIGGSALKAFGSFLGFGGAKAGGGEMLGNRSYLVGEMGPEMFIPRTAGRMLPAGATAAAMGSGRATTNNISINVPGSVNRQTAGQLAADVARELRRNDARNN